MANVFLFSESNWLDASYSGQKQGHRASQQEIRQENKAKTQKFFSKYTNGLLQACFNSRTLKHHIKEEIMKL